MPSRLGLVVREYDEAIRLFAVFEDLCGNRRDLVEWLG
jgi:hypothetical protein